MAETKEMIDHIQRMLAFYLDGSDATLSPVLEQLHNSLEGLKPCA